MRHRCRSVVILCMLICTGTTWAQTEADARLEASIASGLSFLAQQQTAEGAVEGGGPRGAITGLAVMSFLASGHVPDSGKYGLNVRRAVDFLIKSAPEDGYYGRLDGSRMYGQGIITLALSEAYGVEPDAVRRKHIRAILAKSVKLILDAQAVSKSPEHAGGWRYEPQSGDSDLSLSGWNALALRSAQAIGMDVPKENIVKAVGFVLHCYRKDEKSFSYQPGVGGSIAMTGVGVINLYLLDAADRPELDAVKYLIEHPVKEDTNMPYYSMYYAAQAAFQAGDPAWTPVWKVTLDRLLSSQMKDGGWPQSRNGEEPGRVYATSMAVLTMSVPQRLLPIYQR